MESITDIVKSFGELPENATPDAIQAYVRNFGEWANNGADPLAAALAREEITKKLKAAGVSAPG